MPPSPDRSSTSTTLDTVVAGPAADWETVCSLLQETNSQGKKIGPVDLGCRGRRGRRANNTVYFRQRLPLHVLNTQEPGHVGGRFVPPVHRAWVSERRRGAPTNAPMVPAGRGASRNASTTLVQSFTARPARARRRPAPPRRHRPCRGLPPRTRRVRPAW